jgi:hypothetical protein
VCSGILRVATQSSMRINPRQKNSKSSGTT